MQHSRLVPVSRTWHLIFLPNVLFAVNKACIFSFMTVRSLWTQHEAWFSLIAIFISPCFHHNLVLYHMFCPRYAFFLLYFFLGCSTFFCFLFSPLPPSFFSNSTGSTRNFRGKWCLWWLMVVRMGLSCGWNKIRVIGSFGLSKGHLHNASLPRISRFSKEWKSFAMDIVPKKSKIYRAHRTWTIPDLRSIRHLAHPLRNDLIKTKSHVNHFLSDSTCPRTTSYSAFFRFVTLFWSERTKQSTKSCDTRAGWVRQWLSVILFRPGRSKRDKPGFEAIRGRS